MFRIPAYALVLAACMTDPALAGLRQYCDVVYDQPEAWALRSGGKGYQRLGPRDRDSCKGCTLYITGSMTSQEALAELNRGKRFLTDEDPTPTRLDDIKTMQAGRTVLSLASWKVDRDLLFMASFEIGQRATVIGFRGSGSTPDALEASGNAFQNALSDLVAGQLYTVPDGGSPVMPAAEPGPLDGIYWGSITRSTMGLDGMMQMDIRSRIFVFWKEGLFYDGEPDDGLALPATSTFECPNETNGSWGTYRVDGNKVRITYLKGDTETLSLLGGSLFDSDRHMFHAEPVADGERISGVISRFSYSAFNPDIISGGAASSSYVAYHSDGTYTSSSGSGVTGSIKGIGVDAGTIGGVATSSSSIGGGTYTIANSTLRMAPADGGAPISRLIYRVGDGIFIGTDPVKTD